MTYGDWQRPHPELRASDADRERVVEFLREQAGVGRLTPDELDERIGAALKSVTVGDLDRLIADLPRRPPRSAPRRRMQPARREPGHALLPLGVFALLALAAPPLVGGLVVVLAAFGVAAVGILFALSFAFSPLILIALLVVLATRRRRPRSRSMRWDPLH
jgi:Domain of unknown function (DUF1707)